MTHDFIALLRAITNVSMQPLRLAMEEMGFAAVESYGASGNLLFNAPGPDTAALERQIEDSFGTPAFVRTRGELAAVVAHDPFRGRPGASVLFLEAPVSPERLEAFARLELEAERPVIRDRTVYFIHPIRLCGRQSGVNLERELGRRGTIRTSRVVERLLARMSGPAAPMAEGNG